MSLSLIPTLNLSDITKTDYPKVGKKAANIGELIHAKIPVPQGFVITAESYYYFLDMARIREKIVDILTGLDIHDAKEVEHASQLIEDMILKSTMPPAVENAILKSYAKLSGFINTYVAVRSSISADESEDDAFTGMSSTFLNIKGGKDVVLAVKASWASLFDAQSIQYRAEKGIGHMKVGMSVIIQKMVQSEVSGVLYTGNPLQTDPSRIVIEAVLGLGDIIDSEGITPDHYEVIKDSYSIDVKRVFKQHMMVIRSSKPKDDDEQIMKVKVAQKWQYVQKLEDKKIKELAEVGKKIEDIFQTLQDMEWAIDADKLYILQTRPLVQDNLTPHTLQETVQEHMNVPEVISEPVQNVVEQKPSVIPASPVIPEVIPTPIAQQVVAPIIPESKSIIHEETVKPSAIKDPQIIISGSPASEGIVRGIVKVIKTPDDFVQLNPGDILVIDKITPDYVLWLRKASGIITNMGGMTSHAAILAREYKIACIVGTENATEVLRTGDFIEVNGATGRVYKLDGKLLHELPNHVQVERETPSVNDGLHIEYEPTVPAQAIPNIPITIPPIPVATPSSIISAQVAIEEDHKAEEVTLQSNIQPEIPENTFFPQVAIYDPEEEKRIEEESKKNIEVHEPLPQKEVVYRKSIKTATKIYVNLTDLDNATAIADKDIDGIGLLSGTTILNKLIRKHPEAFIEEEDIEKYVTDVANTLQTICADFGHRPVVYRPSNLIASELTFEASKYEKDEQNPLLGYNGALKYIQNPSLFNLEVEILKMTRNKHGHKNLSLMLPMIRNTKDLREMKKIITSNDLKRSTTFKIYLPIESPSSVMLIDELLEIGIDGIFIFAKTLSGLLSASDMDNAQYKHNQIFHEAFMHSAEHILKAAHKDKVPVGIVLEDREFEEHALKKLIEWGVSSLSTDPYYAEKTKLLVAEIEKEIILSKRH